MPDLPAPPSPAVESYACTHCGRCVPQRVARCPSCFRVTCFLPTARPPDATRLILPGAPRGFGAAPFASPFGRFGPPTFGTGAPTFARPADDAAYAPARYAPPVDPETRPLRVPPGVPAIQLSRRCEIPAVAAITQTFAFLGMRGSGKTYAASVLVEDMIEEGRAQLVIVDPLDAMWGLSRNADNSGPSTLGIKVFGSDECGEPLAPDAGRAMARTIVQTNDSYLFSLAAMRRDEQTTFVADLIEELYFLQHTRGTPIHLVVDEADLYAPQANADEEQKRARNAMEDIWRRGRKRGFGGSILTQRPSSISKNVLTQTEVLVVGRLGAPQDHDAVEAWVTANDVGSAWYRMKEALPGLKKGVMFLRSPSWLEAVRRIAVRPKRTFDSSSTPGGGALPFAGASPTVDRMRTTPGTSAGASPTDPPAPMADDLDLEGLDLTQDDEDFDDDPFANDDTASTFDDLDLDDDPSSGDLP